MSSETADQVTAERRGIGPWTVRLLAVLGSLLIGLGVFGWWMSTRVLSDSGFADVVAAASQRVEVRDYIADQATLKLARTSSFVSAARPAVAKAISAAIATEEVEDAIHGIAERAHAQVFQASAQRRVDIQGAQASQSVRAALQTINPSLAKKLPTNVLDVSTTVSQSPQVDLLFQSRPWIEGLWLPVGLLGVALLLGSAFAARDRVRALRTIGITVAVTGALVTGFGAASPAFAVVAATNDPGRGDAVAAFIDELLSRLVDGGTAMILVGLLVAFAPGRDQGDLAARWHRIRAWVERHRHRPAWQIGFAAVLGFVAVQALRDVAGLVGDLAWVAAVVALYVAIVIALRAVGLLEPNRTCPPLRARKVVFVAATLVVALFVTAGAAVSVVAATTPKQVAGGFGAGCNGFLELCEQPLDQIVWPASHNAMNSVAYNFLGAEHTLTVTEQLNAGVRFLMLDAYYGYDQDGLVRTNLAGGVDRKTLERERGPEAVRELDRLGALTGTADTSGKRQDVYFCHNFCELGAVKAADLLAEIDAYLDQHLEAVIVIDVEDYIKPKDLRKALADAGLLDRVWTPKPKDVVNGVPEMPVLGDLVTPHGDDSENPRRLIVMTEKSKSEYPWQFPTYQVSEETPFTFSSARAFTCKPNRGGTGKPLMIVNHWIESGGPPDPVAAANTNSEKLLNDRMQQCLRERRRLPNALAVNFTESGSLFKIVNRYNAAVATVTGVERFLDQELEDAHPSPAERQAFAAVRYDPMSMQKARALLGPVADTLRIPQSVKDAEAERAAAQAP